MYEIQLCHNLKNNYHYFLSYKDYDFKEIKNIIKKEYKEIVNNSFFREKKNKSNQNQISNKRIS